QFIRHFAGQLVRPWWLAGFVHRRRNLGARIAPPIFRRWYARIAWRSRRDLGRFNRHRAINGAEAAMFLIGNGGTGHSGLWHTASMLLPSGSSTNAP